MENTSLYFRQGGSDKVYQAAIEPKGDGFVVNFAYGRRGAALTMGTKTQNPVPEDKAREVYRKLVASKMAKGYTPGEGGTPFQNPDAPARDTGLRPQLLNPVEEAQALVLVSDSSHWMQEKKDGRRMLIQKREATVRGINRKGLEVGLDAALVAATQALPHDFTIDGELVGPVYHAFDLLEVDSHDQRGTSYRERYQTLAGLLSFTSGNLRVVPIYRTAQEKAAAFSRLKNENDEGVVFKLPDAPYTAGRPASGGSQLKFKFYATASFIVRKVNTQRSIELGLRDDNVEIPVGNVTIPQNHEIPEKGKIVEVRYLYAFKGGSVYQPVFLGLRDDIATAACTLSQIKYKEIDTDEEEAEVA